MPTATLPRIAVYVPALVGGGAERAAAILASGFRAAGAEVRLFVDFEAAENRGFLDPAVAVVPLGRSHAGAVRALARHLAAGTADVVLAVGGAANLKLAAAQALARAGRIPIVLSFHGRSDVGRGRLGWAAFALSPLLTRRAARTVCVSQSLRRHLVEEWRGLAARVVAIPNAIPVEAARAALGEAELLARPATIVALGRLVREKDFPTLIRAAARLPGDATLVIHGEGPERGALQALANDLGFGARLVLPGYAANPWPAYGEGRVFALSSLSEGFGNVVVEALASGLPVVATDCGGPREILEDGRHGALVPVGDVDGLARALAGALARPGDPAPRVARAQRYATHRVVHDYLALFDDVIRETASGLGQGGLGQGGLGQGGGSAQGGGPRQGLEGDARLRG
ncbi:D-inositol-3-phosphate glycosyltransferase [Methylobacterium crusticola]|uniref:D-inositol-3-phosphate glycosyltransferase n=1 Tax=Methylobacterium crusticola TaxID=1697972 RepID=A0ABQ4QSA1_9HYPH|nr:glycosyltransferase [Methylobacterium crusticola]GJD47482.1 D-inositol-3-phosphate glycosyltransferase [Methylobacterium crusticola]